MAIQVSLDCDTAKTRLGVERSTAANLEQALIPRAFDEGDGVIEQTEVLPQNSSYLLNSFFDF